MFSNGERLIIRWVKTGERPASFSSGSVCRRSSVVSARSRRRMAFAFTATSREASSAKEAQSTSNADQVGCNKLVIILIISLGTITNKHRRQSRDKGGGDDGEEDGEFLASRVPLCLCWREEGGLRRVRATCIALSPGEEEGEGEEKNVEYLSARLLAFSSVSYENISISSVSCFCSSAADALPCFVRFFFPFPFLIYMTRERL